MDTRDFIENQDETNNNEFLALFYCDNPIINVSTQQPINCSKDGLSYVICHPAPHIRCEGLIENENTFTMPYPCQWTNGTKFETALLLSVFFGFLGADRFYLGYPAIGTLKLCTCGFIFIGHILDVILVATQILKPSDGSNYVMNYYGANLHKRGSSTSSPKAISHFYQGFKEISSQETS